MNQQTFNFKQAHGGIGGLLFISLQQEQTDEQEEDTTRPTTIEARRAEAEASDHAPACLLEVPRQDRLRPGRNQSSFGRSHQEVDKKELKIFQKRQQAGFTSADY